MVENALLNWMTSYLKKTSGTSNIWWSYMKPVFENNILTFQYITRNGADLPYQRASDQNQHEELLKAIAQSRHNHEQHCKAVYQHWELFD